MELNEDQETEFRRFLDNPIDIIEHYEGRIPGYIRKRFREWKTEYLRQKIKR